VAGVFRVAVALLSGMPRDDLGVTEVNEDPAPGGAVTDEPQQPMMSSAETREAVATQIQDVRDVLRTDGAAAGIDIARVDAAVDTALAAYQGARVHGFIGVFVERDVRAALRLGRVSAADDDAPGEAPA
jgi:hypothetical protein